MYCRNCGKEIDDKAYVCPFCGVKTQDVEAELAAANRAADAGTKVGWGILSFLIPLVGLILFLTWKTERPRTASVCGKCALAAVIVEVVGVILSVIISAVMLGSIAGTL